VAYLADAGTAFEERMLTSWLRHEVGDAEVIPIRSSRRRRSGDTDRLRQVLGPEGEKVFLVPLRVVWMPPRNRQGRRSVSLSDLFKPGDPRDPYAIRARWIRYLRPKRVKLLATQGAFAGEMIRDHDRSGRLDPIETYVTRRAWRSLDHGERKLQGNRYKIPRFVTESMLARRDFIESIDEVALTTGMGRDEAHRRAERYLREIAATHSPYVIDLIAGLIQRLYKQGYGEIKYSPDQVREIAALGQDHPVVFLPSHRSNLDRLSLQFTLWENDLPPNHTAGGINLNFFPIGPLIRRTGVFFIRRSFRDNDLYKTVLRSYLGYLMEKHFPLEFYLEGGRSRSGKLLPPRMGLLSYVADSHRRGRVDDIKLVPVSIAYDQIQDVPDYAREAQGNDKKKESVRWLFRAVRSLRRRYGNIYIRFGEPVSLADYDVGDAGREASTDIRKVALEVMHRIAKATPVTPTSLMSIVLLARGGRPGSPAELGQECSRLADFAQAREIVLTEHADLADPTVAGAILTALEDNGYVTSHAALGRSVYWLDDDQMVRISYYRNMVAHFFLPRSTAEMALARIADGAGSDSFEEAVLATRDLMKFEFFFSGRAEFADTVRRDIAIDVPGWEQTLESEGGDAVIAKMGDPVAYWAVLPLLDAYQVVGDELEALRGRFEERPFLKACLARARMYRIEGRVISGESASQVLFKSALALAENRGLLDADADVDRRRARFADEVREARALAARAD